MANPICLLIEDSKIQANVIMQMLSKLGCDVFTALDFSSAENILKVQKNVNFILTDLILPDSDGLETVKKIKQINPNLIICAMTAGDKKIDASAILKNARSQGAQYLIHKPFDFVRLAQMINQIKFCLDGGILPPLALIIDDSGTIRTVCEKMLVANGFRTQTAQSIDDAFEQIDGFDLDVILTDYNMPGISPIEAIPMIRDALPGVGIVVMTGSKITDINHTLQLGADTAITKPFTPEILVQSLKKAMIMASARLLAAAN